MDTDVTIKRLNPAAVHDLRVLRKILEEKTTALRQASAANNVGKATRLYADVQDIKKSLTVVRGRLYV